MPVYAGVTGYVKMGATSVPFNKWKIRINTEIGKYFAYGNSGQLTTDGCDKADLDVGGMHDVGNTPVSSGSLYEFHLGYALGVELVLMARVSEILLDADIERPTIVGVKADSHGDIDPSID